MAHMYIQTYLYGLLFAPQIKCKFLENNDFVAVYVCNLFSYSCSYIICINLINKMIQVCHPSS